MWDTNLAIITVAFNSVKAICHRIGQAHVRPFKRGGQAENWRNQPFLSLDQPRVVTRPDLTIVPRRMERCPSDEGGHYRQGTAPERPDSGRIGFKHCFELREGPNFGHALSYLVGYTPKILRALEAVERTEIAPPSAFERVARLGSIPFNPSFDDASRSIEALRSLALANM